MRSEARLLTGLLAIATLLANIVPANAQEIAVLDATPGPVYGDRPGDNLSLPTDVAVDSRGVVYVVDSGRHRVARYRAAGGLLGYFASEGKGEGQLHGPVGIATSPDGRVYVADRGNQRLQVFESDGAFRRSLELTENESPVTPVDVAVAADGRSLFVTAGDSHRVLAIEPDGRVRSGWGGEGKDPGSFRYPASLTIDAASGVLVVDVLNCRVQVFDNGGVQTAEFGSLGAKPGSFLRPKGVAVDNAGRVYVSDSYLGVVQVFTRAGEFLGILGAAGEPLRFEAPTGLAWTSGRLYVTDMLAGVVRSFDVEGAP